MFYVGYNTKVLHFGISTIPPISRYSHKAKLPYIGNEIGYNDIVLNPSDCHVESSLSTAHSYHHDLGSCAQSTGISKRLFDFSLQWFICFGCYDSTSNVIHHGLD